MMNGNNGLPDMAKILNAVKQRRFFNELTRYRYNYNADDALKIVEAIGKVRNPKFVIDEHNRFAYINFIKWIHGDTTMQAMSPTDGKLIPGRLKRGIYIAGKTGSGKSWCIEIMQAYAQAIGAKIMTPFDTEPSNLYWQTIRADEVCEEYAAKGSFARYKKKPIIAVQDFGAEPQEVLYMGNRIDVMRQFIEFRGDMPIEITLISSNLKLGGDVLQDRYGDRVASRLVEMCNYLELSGTDRRLI